MLAIQSNVTPTITTIVLTGRLDAYAGRTIEEQLARVPTSRIVVDLAAVEFVDSAGLATLMRARRRCRTEQGDLRLCGVRPRARLIFDMMPGAAFDVYADPETAVQAFAA